MQRISISIDDDLLATIDSLSSRRGYASRSEALRDIVRDAVMREQAADAGETLCFATLSYVYEHEARDLARRLTNSQHHHHELSVATMHVHVSERDCLEVVVLKGAVKEIQAFSDSITSQRGVRMGSLHIVPADPSAGNELHDARTAHHREHKV